MGRPPQSASPPPSSSPRVITFGFLCIRITIELHSRWLARTPHVSRGVVHTPHTLKHPSADKGLAVMADDDDNNNNSKNGKRKNIRHMCVRAASERNSLSSKGADWLSWTPDPTSRALAACRFSREVGLEGTICRTPATAAAAAHVFNALAYFSRRIIVVDRHSALAGNNRARSSSHTCEQVLAI
jgi:hypothetical protein